MKTIKFHFLFLLIFFASLTQAHEYYFAFGEIQFNVDAQRFEVSIRATGHDFEDYMKHKKKPIGKLENANNPITLKQISLILNEEFQLFVDGSLVELELVGLEVNLKDEVQFYLTSNKMDKPDSFEVNFNLLMDFFPEQQNKITVFHENGKTYLSFLPHLTKRKFSYEDLAKEND